MPVIQLRSLLFLLIKPILSPGFMRRGQVDLIDMSHDCHGKFKWIGHYIDHFTKFNFLWSQQRKKASEVVNCLITHVFSVVGLPVTLQHDNGSEFCNKVKYWICLLHDIYQLSYLFIVDHSTSC